MADVVVVLRHHHLVVREVAAKLARDEQAALGLEIDVVRVLAKRDVALAARNFDKLEQGLFRDERVHHAVVVVDRTLDIGEAVAVGRDHFGDAVADDEFRSREREARLLVRDRKRGVADKIVEHLGRQLHRRRLELRDLRELLAADAGEAKVAHGRTSSSPIRFLPS